MPTYNIAGKRITTADPLTDDQIDEISKAESGPRMSALPPAESARMHAADSAEDQTNSEKFAPKFLGDTPMGGDDKGALDAAGSMARFISPVTAAPLAPAVAGAAAVGPPAVASLAGRTAAGAALGGAADYGLRKVGVPSGVSDIAGLALGLHGLRSPGAGATSAAAEDAETYMPRLLDSIKRNLGFKTISSAAEDVAGSSTPSWSESPQERDTIGPARTLKMMDVLRDLGGPPEWQADQTMQDPTRAADSLKRLEVGRSAPMQATPEGGFASGRGTGMGSMAEDNARVLRKLKAAGFQLPEPEGAPGAATGETAATTTTAPASPKASRAKSPASMSTRVSSLQRAIDETAQIRKLLGDTNYKLNVTTDPAERESLRKVASQLARQLNTRSIKVAGAEGGPSNLIVAP